MYREDQIGGERLPELSDEAIEIVNDSTHYNRKFKVSTRNITLGLNINHDDYISANSSIERFFIFICDRIAGLAGELDKISFFVNHPSLTQPILIPFVRKEDFTADLISNNFIRVCQSKTSLRIDNTLLIKSQIAAIPVGRGFELEKIIHDKRSIYCIKNNDSLCGLRAFIIGIFLAQKRRRIHDMIKSCHNKEIEKMMIGVNVDFTKGCDLSAMKLIEQHFKNFQLVIYDEMCTITKKFIYCGPLNNVSIYLLLYKNHYYPIRSPKCFFNTKYFCHYCKKPHNYISTHKCDLICSMCKIPECSFVKKQQCRRCLKFSNSDACMTRHDIVCSYNKKCETCQKFFYSNNHVCTQDFRWCENCQLAVEYSHRCFIKPDTIVPCKYKGYIFYDYEAAHSVSNTHVGLIN